MTPKAGRLKTLTKMTSEFYQSFGQLALNNRIIFNNRFERRNPVHIYKMRKILLSVSVAEKKN